MYVVYMYVLHYHCANFLFSIYITECTAGKLCEFPACMKLAQSVVIITIITCIYPECGILAYLWHTDTSYMDNARYIAQN